MLETMYPAAANSRQTELAAAIDDTQTSITVLDGSVLPDAPNELVIDPANENAETILYTGKTGNTLTGVTRGFEGVAQSWVAGTKIARFFTAYDFNTFKGNIVDLDERLNNIPAPEDASLTQKGIVQLSSATESDSETESATPKAVNTVRQLAVSQIGDLTGLQTTDKDNLVDALNEVFTHVDEGKELVKTAVIVKGGTVAGTSPHSFEELADGIDTIETSTVINGQQQVARTYAETIVANDPIYTKTTYNNNVNFSTSPAVSNYLTLSSDGVYLAVSMGSSPFINIYKRSGTTYTKLPDPPVLPTGTAQALAFSPDGVYLAVPHASSPFITIYKRSGDTFTKLPNPTLLPVDFGICAAFSPDGTYLVIGNANTGPYLTIYKRSGDTFTRLAYPSIMPSSGVNGAAFSPDGIYLTVVGGGSPFITIYKRSGDTFTKINDSTVGLVSNGRAVSISPDGAYFAIAHLSAPTVTIFKQSGDTFTRLPDLGGVSLGNGVGIGFSPIDGSHLVVTHSLAPCASVFKKSGERFVQTDALDVTPAGAPSSVSFDASGSTLAIKSGLSPYALLYTTLLDRVYKSNNLMSDVIDKNSVGYALESGNSGETKEILTIWR
ncbi:tail fiber protein [Paenibacillus xylanexedens]|uniref:tail fiber protein n=1 Tax=Paenibacillus xylanexedens TaxID=528191 RepID=UPI003D0025BA